MLVYTESGQRLASHDALRSEYSGLQVEYFPTGGRNNGPAFCFDYVFPVYPQHPVPSGSAFLGGARLCGNSSGAVIAACWNGSGQVGVFVFNDGHLEIRTGTTLSFMGTMLATTAAGFYDGAVRYLSFGANIDAAAGATGVFLDGVEVTALTLSGVNTKPQMGGLWNSFVNGGVKICDLAVADGTDPSGTGDDVHDLWMEAAVDHKPGSGNGYASQMVGNDANSVDNYLLVREAPPDDDTTYVQSIDPAIDAYIKGAVRTGATILGTRVCARARKTDAGVALLKVGMRGSGTNTMGDEQALATSYVNIYQCFGHDPAGGALTKSALDAMEIVVEKT
jgi:hypothetical protein